MKYRGSDVANNVAMTQTVKHFKNNICSIVAFLRMLHYVNKLSIYYITVKYHAFDWSRKPWKVLLKDDGNLSVLNIERLDVINPMSHTLC